jgi:hypothetical protein
MINYIKTTRPKSALHNIPINMPPQVIMNCNRN